MGGKHQAIMGGKLRAAIDMYLRHRVLAIQPARTARSTIVLFSSGPVSKVASPSVHYVSSKHVSFELSTSIEATLRIQVAPLMRPPDGSSSIEGKQHRGHPMLCRGTYWPQVRQVGGGQSGRFLVPIRAGVRSGLSPYSQQDRDSTRRSTQRMPTSKGIEMKRVLVISGLCLLLTGERLTRQSPGAPCPCI